MPTLADPLPLPCGQTLKNRIVKSATSEALARAGAPSDGLVRLYETWARGGAGLLVTGNVVFDVDGRENPRNVLITDRRHLDGLRRWAGAAHEHGASVWMQINHAGRQAARRTTSRPVAPSAVPLEGLFGLAARPRALGHDDIVRLIEGFARTAAVAAEAGFDGVQIHAAHGYLISQFLSPRINRRDDEWGGDAQRRRRFLLEVVAATRAAIGPDRALSVKLNSADFQRGGFGEDESIEVARALEAAGIDVLEISGGNYESPAMMGVADRRRRSTLEREAYFLDFARRLRAQVDLPLSLTGGLRNGSTMRAIIEAGEVDLVGMARPLIVEPDLPARLLADPDAAARPVDLGWGLKSVDAMLEALWYMRQLERIAAGLAPDPDLGRLGTLVRGFARSYAPLPRARSRRRAAGTPA